jgi:hypothetical protein
MLEPNRHTGQTSGNSLSIWGNPPNLTAPSTHRATRWSYRDTACRALLVALAGATISCVTDSTEREFTANASSPLLIAKPTARMFSRGSINVCWNTPGYPTERSWVYAALKNGWDQESAITFAYFGDCFSGFKGIRLTFQQSVPNGGGSGFNGDGTADLYLMLDNPAIGNPSVCDGDLRSVCMQATALHEMGHLLGAAHEQARGDNPLNPKTPPANLDPVGPFDWDSVMAGVVSTTGVPPLHRNHLSAGDIMGVRQLWGGPTMRQGVYSNGQWYLEFNGDDVWSWGEKSSTGYYTRSPDTYLSGFGDSSSIPVGGDWSRWSDTSPKLISKIGVYRDGYWWLDVNGNGIWDSADRFNQFGSAAYLPIPGRWNSRFLWDVLGLYKDGYWYLDYNDSGAWDSGDVAYGQFGQPGDQPVRGNWSGNVTSPSADCLGVRTPGGSWFIDYNCNLRWDGVGSGGDLFFPAFPADPQPTDIAVAGDWDNQHKARIGVYRDGQWLLDMNGNGAWDEGTDRRLYLGGSGWMPVVGRW